LAANYTILQRIIYRLCFFGYDIRNKALSNAKRLTIHRRSLEITCVNEVVLLSKQAI